MKTLLFLQSYALLIRIDLMMHFRSFEAIHSLVRSRRVAARTASREPDAEAVCHAVDLACIYYVKPVLCLQRSSATAILLRRYGWQAEMVIGAQLLPFKSHAWVEIAEVVVNDKPYMREIYSVLERC